MKQPSPNYRRNHGIGRFISKAGSAVSNTVDLFEATRLVPLAMIQLPMCTRYSTGKSLV
ncbi:uncharacterized protein BJ212DRAFT_202846 [Suillus subaureus]|uniref:Uncharacterized protein n=1 Tax=Suillus subaureus TaxID=48587 RepID=A0A9P7JDF8_9AGAM|nr:uncharacterized protein BJ212DRAFT_202846 [Suillus subaureus]KAG1815940.1 hypothetical protein BJ212DRAFT_202846 [Suillus subaureus]